MVWKVNDRCFFVENRCRVIPAVITSVHGEFCTLKYKNNKGIRLRISRLYPSLEEARGDIKEIPVPGRGVNPYLYRH